MSTETAIPQLAQLIDSGDYRQALGYLNGLVGFRFTALYRRDDPQMWNVVLYDAEHPAAPQFPAVAQDETYCSMAMRQRDAFTVADAQRDARTAAHPARDVVRAYCGAPLYDADGEAIGTLCHFDFLPIESPPDTPALLREVSYLFTPGRVDDALRQDIALRVDKLASLLPVVASALPTDAERRDAFAEYAAPIRRMTPRLDAPSQADVETHLATLLATLLATPADP